MFRAFAQPTTSAPTPTHASADVISVFSDAYTNQSGTDFNPNWGQSTIVADYVLSGDNMKKYSVLSYQGTDFGSNKINASSMSSLHFDLWTENCATFDFYLINNNINFEQKITVTPSFTGWNSYDIALTSFASNIVSNIGQFKYVGIPQVNVGSTKIVYLDNIYFWKPNNVPSISGFTVPTKIIGDAPFVLTPPTSTSPGAFTYTSSNTSVATVSNDTVTVVGVGSSSITANQAAGGGFTTGSTSANLIVIYPPPTTTAATPTHLAGNVMSVYSGAYTNIAGTNFYPNWGQSTTLTNIAVSGDDILKYDNLNYQGMEFVANQNISQMENLHFDIWTPNCAALEFYLINTAPQLERKITVTPTLSGWNSFDIPFTSFVGFDFTRLRQIKLVGTNGSTIYLDNIYFWKSASSPTITGFSVPAKFLGDAAFMLTAPTSNSTGAFTYTSSNTSVATVSGSTVTIVGVGSTTITANQAGDGTYTAGSTSAQLVVTYSPPTVAAPTPTRDAADVLSIFSDAYTNISGTDFFPNWGQSTVVSDIMVAGNTTKSYQNLNYQGIQFASAVDAAAFSELHLDLWTPNCTAFQVFLINAGGVEQPITLNPTASGWNSFDISLASYTTINKAAIIQFKLVGTPFGSSAVYLDNIYFWKATPVVMSGFSVPAKLVGDAPFALTAPTSNSPAAFTYSSSNTSVATISGGTVTIVGAGTSTITAMQAPTGSYGSGSTSASLVVTLPPLPPAPITAAATPTHPAFNVISLFSDAYTNVAGTNFFPNWGQSTQVVDTMVDGNTTKKYTNLNYQGIQFAGTINASLATSLHVDIWTSTCTAFQVFLINTATGAEVPYTLNPTLGGWNSFDIALSNYPSNIVNHVNQIKLVGTPFGGSKVYLDNLYFWANSCINIVTAPSVSIAADMNNVCNGTSVVFTATPTNGGTAPNYNFKVNGTSVQNGAMATYTTTMLANGNSVSCDITRTDGCAAAGSSNSVVMMIKASPAAGTIINYKLGGTVMSASLCKIGDTIQLVNYSTGVWASSNSAVATATTASFSSGKLCYVVAQTAGTSNVTYGVTGTNGCSSAATVAITVAPIAVPDAITGGNGVCVASTLALTTTSTGGFWNSVAGAATVNAMGVVTGTSAGTANIRYTVSNAAGCRAWSSKSVVVTALPGTPSIGYKAPFSNPQAGAPTGGFCVGKVFGVSGSPAAGVWSATGCISVTSLGVATINTTGAGSITYTTTNAAGCSKSRTMTGTGFACAARGSMATNEILINSGFTMYPNPAKSIVNVLVDKLIGEGQVIVTDLYGKTIKTQTLSMGNNNVNIANLSKGFYLVSMITAQGKKTQKLVVE